MRAKCLRVLTAGIAIAGLTAALLVATSGGRRDDGVGEGKSLQRPLQQEIAADVAPLPDWLVTREVRADVRAPRARYDETAEFRSAVDGFDAAFRPTVKRPRPKGVGIPVEHVAVEPRTPTATVPDPDPAPLAPLGAGQVASFESTDFNDNITNTGNIFIPADPQGAAGPNHVVGVTNTTLAIHLKNGTVVQSISLRNFFNALSPLTFTFDPRVIYDEHNARWLVITAEFTDTTQGAAANTSRIFIGVSDSDDPTGGWTLAAIDAVTTFFNPGVGTVAHWVDYPQISVDEEAIYITGSMFSFFSSGGQFGGVRIWIIGKGVGTGGFYDGGNATVNQYNPFSASAIRVGSTPAMVFGTPASSTFGTFLVGYSGITDGVNEAVQVIRVSNALGTPTFTPSLVLLGNIHNTSIDIPEAPQSGTTRLVRTNDPRALKAVWRNDNLWTAFTITPNTGDPEVGQAVAHWVRMVVSGTPVLGEQGRVSGEDIAPGTYTFFPSLSVNSNLDVMIGFAASGSSIFPGAYYALHDVAASPGTVGPTQTLRAGIDFYIRTFGGPFNRWGDFSSVAVDPVDGCFWIYNKYAFLRGTPTGGEEGRWGTRFAKFCNTECAGVPDPVTNLAVNDLPDTTLSWDELGTGFTYDVVIGTVSVMRADGMVGPAGCLAPSIATPGFVDTLPNPPAGEARYYVVRGRSVCENGDYGTDSDGVLRAPTPGCPD